MKKKTKLFLTLAMSAVSVLCLATACKKEVEGPLGEEYNWTFDKPYAGEIDEYMTMDGKLDEDVWKDNSVLAYANNSVSWSSTTHFSNKGVYIGLKAIDATMSYNTRYSSRSIFMLYLCKSGTETYNINSTGYHNARCFEFYLDANYCRARTRVPYYYEAYVDGELNSETECTMTAELFLSWEDLYYTPEELGENGYPEDVQMYVNYEGEANEVLGSCSWREETYFYYGKDGYLGELAHDKYGNISNGFASTDQWNLTEGGKPQTTAGRTQILWLKDAFAKDFMFEATLKPLSTTADGNRITLRGENVYGRIGLINAVPQGRYTIFSADATEVSQGRIQLQTCQQIDSFHWQNLIGKYEVVKTDYTEDMLTMRVVKQGDMFYYFYGDTYWGSERIADLSDKAYCGLYTSQGVLVEDCKFTDYTGKNAELQEELSQYMYFVDVSGEMTRGSVSTSSYAVAKGEEVSITFLAKSKSILTAITQDGQDVYDEIVAAMNDKCEYTFTPTADVSFDAEFTSFADKDLVKSVIVFQDKSGNRVMDANYEVRGSNKLLFYKGQPNASGYVILQIPKAGTYAIAGKEIVVDGDYSVYSKFSGHHEVNTNFILNDDTTSVDINGKEESVKDTRSFTMYVPIENNAWGTVTVNGYTVNGLGTLQYNEETGNYYVQDSAVRLYYKTMVGGDFVVDAHISMTEVGGNGGHLAAITLTDGNDVIVFKYNIDQWDNLIIATGNMTTESSTELAITGFGWAGKKHQLVTETQKGETEMAIRIVKCGSAFYLFNHDRVMRAYFNKDGMHLMNESYIVWGQENLYAVNEDIKGLFSSGDEMAVGVFVYPDTGIRAEFSFDFSTNIEDVYNTSIDYGEFTVSLADGCKLAKEYTVREGYAQGEIVQLGVDIKNARYANLKMIIVGENGVQVVDGKYDWTNYCVSFTFEYAGGNANATVIVVNEGDMEWSNDWGDFDPNRDNTIVN